MEKPWPRNDNQADFCKIVDPLVLFAKKLLKDPEIKKDIKYTGLKHGPLTAATCLGGSDIGLAETRRWSYEEHGKEPLRLVISLAVQLGIEQGRRTMKSKKWTSDI